MAKNEATRSRHDRRHGNTFANIPSRFAERVTGWTGSSSAFALAVITILVWGVLGPIFHYSDTWQLVINTSTTIVTFLMVFLIQRAQNKESLAVQLKLNEIVAAVEGASNRLISVEELSEEELNVLRCHYKRLALKAASEGRITESHSIEEAEARHAFKRDRRRQAEAHQSGERSHPGERSQ
jgi:low affinity Fe/Cu permease